MEASFLGIYGCTAIIEVLGHALPANMRQEAATLEPETMAHPGNVVILPRSKAPAAA